MINNPHPSRGRGRGRYAPRLPPRRGNYGSYNSWNAPVQSWRPPPRGGFGQDRFRHPGGRKRHRSPQGRFSSNYPRPKRKWDNRSSSSSNKSTNVRTFKLKRLVLASGNPTEDERQHNALYSSFYDTFLEGKVDLKAKTIFVNAKQVKGSRFSARITPDHLYAINIFSEALPKEAFFDNFEEQTKLKSELADFHRQTASKATKLVKLQEKLDGLSEEKEVKKAEIEIKQVELEAVELKEKLVAKESRLKELQAAVFEPEEDITMEENEKEEEAVEEEEDKPEEEEAVEEENEDDDVIVEETEKEDDEGTIDLTKDDPPPQPTTTETPQRFRVLLGLKEPLESVKGVFCDIPDAKESIPKVHCLLLEMEPSKGKKYTELKDFFGQYLEKCCGDVNKDLESWGSKKCTGIATKLLKEAIEKRKMDFETEDCPNGCEQSFRVYELQAHRMNDCRKRLVGCKFCKQEFVADTLQDHHDECPKFRLRCVNGCGKSIPREDMEKHKEEDCTFQIICCDYARYGCSAKLKKRGKAQHMKSQVQYHLNLVEKGFCVVAQKYDRLQTFLKEKYEDFPDMTDLEPKEPEREVIELDDD